MWACSVTLEKVHISSSSPSTSVIIFGPGFPAKGWISEFHGPKRKWVIFWLGYLLGYNSCGLPRKHEENLGNSAVFEENQDPPRDFIHGDLDLEWIS